VKELEDKIAAFFDGIGEVITATLGGAMKYVVAVGLLVAVIYGVTKAFTYLP